MTSYLIPPQVLYAAVEAGYTLRPDTIGCGWLIVMKDGAPFCTILKSCTVLKAVEVLS